MSGPPIRSCVVSPFPDGGSSGSAALTTPASPKAPLRDLGDGVLLPGLVNAHCHLDLSDLAETARPFTVGFVPWVEGVVSSRGPSGRGGRGGS